MPGIEGERAGIARRPRRDTAPRRRAVPVALAVAARLVQVGFAGPLLVLAPPLPNPRMVEREIRNQSGGLEVRVVTRER